MSQMQPGPAPRNRWNPGGKVLWWVAGAFALGLLLFLALWLGQRGDDDFYRSEAEPGTTPGQVFQPLPTPLPAGEAASAAAPSASDAFSSQILEPLPSPPERPPPAMETQPATPVAPPLPAPPPVADTPRTRGPDSAPRPISAPPPDYPRQALRSRTTGTVMLRVDVGTDGRAANVGISRGSGSRDLDRAAVRAVQQWRFEPARRGGQPVMGTLDIPIEFTLR